MRKLDLNKYENILVDMDGVVLMQEKLILKADKALEELMNITDVYILSNNDTKTRNQIADRLGKFGLNLPPSNIINSTFLMAKYLMDQCGRTKVFVLGERGLRLELEEFGHKLVQPTEAEVIVVGTERDITYEKFNRALTALLGGAEFYVANADRTFPTADGEAPGAGTTVGGIKGMGFSPDKYVCKPSKTAAETAMEIAGTTNPSSCLLIGDRLDVDILTAERVGMDSILVLTGAESRESLENSEIRPTYVFESLYELTGRRILR